MKHGLFLLGVGAGLMYFFDPQNGARRRALARDRYLTTVRTLDEGRRVVTHSSPRTKSRAVAGALGSALAVLGLLRGGLGGLAIGALGTGLVARAATNDTNDDVKSIAGTTPDCQGESHAELDETGNFADDAALGANVAHGQEISAPPPGVQRH